MIRCIFKKNIFCIYTIKLFCKLTEVGGLFEDRVWVIYSFYSIVIPLTPSQYPKLQFLTLAFYSYPLPEGRFSQIFPPSAAMGICVPRLLFLAGLLHPDLHPLLQDPKGLGCPPPICLFLTRGGCTAPTALNISSPHLWLTVYRICTSSSNIKYTFTLYKFLVL